MREPPGRRALGLLLALALAAAVWVLGTRGEKRTLLVALDAEEAAALCAQAGYPLADFWERAKALGVAAAVVREKPLSYYMERGDVLRFTREELEKWRALGLIASGASLKPNTLWARNPRVLSQAVESTRREGLMVTTSSASGYHLAEFASGADLGLPAGYDPEILQPLEGRGLVLMALASGKASPIETAGSPLSLDVRSIDVQAGLGAWLRAVYGHFRRLLLVRLSARGVEKNFEVLRGVLRGLARRGVRLSGAPAPGPEPRMPWPRLRSLMAWVLGILGPLLAARGGLLALKRTRALALSRFPIASPVVQLAAGAGAAALAAVAIGLAARAVLDFSPSAAGRWTLWTLTGPMILGLLTLYTIDLEEWRENLRLPLTYGGALKGLALLAGLALLLRPRLALGWAGLWPRVEALGELSAGLWWVPGRWREMLIGFPCLLHAFFLVNWGLDCPDCETRQESLLSDPRGWFLLGLLGPIGVITAVGKGAVPLGLALEHTALSLLAGMLLGAFGLGLRLWGLEHAHGSKDPRRDGPMDPEAQV